MYEKLMLKTLLRLLRVVDTIDCGWHSRLGSPELAEELENALDTFKKVEDAADEIKLYEKLKAKYEKLGK